MADRRPEQGTPRPYEIASLREWRSGAPSFSTSDPQPPLPLVDLRNAERFAERRIDASAAAASASAAPQPTPAAAPAPAPAPAVVVANLPLPDLLSGHRSPELPPRSVEFAILVPRDRYEAQGVVGDVVLDAAVERFFFRRTSRRTGKSVRPWSVAQVLLDSDGLWGEAEELGIMASSPPPQSPRCSDDAGSDHAGAGGEEVAAAFAPRPRLWRPDPLVRDAVLPALLTRIDDVPELSGRSGGDGAGAGAGAGNEIGGAVVGEVWDLGSGAGRDVCYLAEETKARYHRRRRRITVLVPEEGEERVVAPPPFPFRFVGLDAHKSSPKRCLPLWERRGVGDVTESRLFDLDKVDAVREIVAGLCCPPSGTADGVRDCGSCATDRNLVCVYAVRYLNRKLFRYLAGRGCPLPKGTLFATSNFCTRDAGSTWDFDHPKEKNVLERNELRNLFEGTGQWKVLKDDIATDDDLGRTLVQFVAEKEHKPI